MKISVKESMLQTLQQVDQYGRKMWTYENGQRKAVTYQKMMSKDEILRLCDTIAEMLMKKYGYSDVEILYPSWGTSYTSGVQPNFPNKLLKRSIKKNPADTYVEFKMDINGKKGPFAIIKDLSSGQVEDFLLFDMTGSLTVYNSRAEIVDQVDFTMNNFDELFAEKYATSMEGERYRVSGKSYLSFQDMLNLYTLAENTYMLKEN